MISVEEIYQSLLDLTRKDQAGYSSSEEFNRALETTQQVLYNFYLDQVEDKSLLRQALAPFVKESVLTLTAGAYPVPADFRLEESVEFVTYTQEGTVRTPQRWPAYQYGGQSRALELTSPVRKPDNEARTYGYDFVGGVLRAYPSTFSGEILLEYYSNPPEAKRGFTVDASNLIEVHDPSTTVDLEWNVGERDNIIDIMLAYRGLAIKDNYIVQWAAQRGAIALPTEVITNK